MRQTSRYRGAGRLQDENWIVGRARPRVNRIPGSDEEGRRRQSGDSALARWREVVAATPGRGGTSDQMLRCPQRVPRHVTTSAPPEHGGVHLHGKGASMDTDRFDSLAKSFSASSSRRGIIRLVAALPITGGLVALLARQVTHGQGNVAGVGGGGRRRRRGAGRGDRDHHDDHKKKGNRKDKGKGKGKGKGCTPNCAANVCGPDGCGGSCGECGCGSRCCNGACCPPGPSDLTQVCYQGACCEPQCDAVGVTCGPGNESAKCGLASCGTCPNPGDVCVSGVCNSACAAPNPCTIADCDNCLVRPNGAPICASSTGSTCTGTCQSDADCCPGTICGASAAACTRRMVCYQVAFDPPCPP